MIGRWAQNKFKKFSPFFQTHPVEVGYIPGGGGGTCGKGGNAPGKGGGGPGKSENKFEDMKKPWNVDIWNKMKLDIAHK